VSSQRSHLQGNPEILLPKITSLKDKESVKEKKPSCQFCKDTKKARDLLLREEECRMCKPKKKNVKDVK